LPPLIFFYCFARAVLLPVLGFTLRHAACIQANRPKLTFHGRPSWLLG